MQFLILPRRRPVRGPSWNLNSNVLTLPVEASPGVALEARARDLPRAFTTSGGVCHIEAGEGKKLPSFEGVAYTGAVMRPGGWFGNVIIDLDGVKIPSQTRPVLRQHDHEQLLGHTTSVAVTRAGLEVAGVFSGEKHHVAKVVVPARNSFAWQLSVGANPVHWSTWKPAKPPRSTAAKSPDLSRSVVRPIWGKSLLFRWVPIKEPASALPPRRVANYHQIVIWDTWRR